MAGPIEVKVPDIGDFKEVGVIELLVAPGDRVEKESSLITVESDKATMEIPSPVAGVIKELKVKLGDKISEGSVILMLEESGDGAPSVAPASTPAGTAPSPTAPQPVQPAPAAPKPADVQPIAKPDPVPVEPQDATVSKPHASPSIRVFARELGVELARVKGSGPKGRITREDVQALKAGRVCRSIFPSLRRWISRSSGRWRASRFRA
jgi:pyruvate dehydrogenase E2 component (dihydrolipoamide acetyltransferase)